MFGLFKKRVATVHHYLVRVLYVLGPQARRALLPLVLGFIFLSSLDLIGLSLIGPFVALAVDAESLGKLLAESWLEALLADATPMQVVATVGAAIVGVFIIKSFAGFFVNRKIMRFAMRHQRDTKLRLLEAYLSLPLERALEKHSATLLTTANEHVLIFSNRVLVPLLKAAAELVFFAFLFVFLLVNNPWITLFVGFVLIAMGTIYDALIKRQVAAAGKRSIHASKNINKTVAQSADGFKEIRILDARDFFLGHLKNYSDIYADAGVFMQSLAVLPRYLIESTVVTLVVVLLVAGLALHGTSSPELLSTVGVFAFAAVRAMPSINTLLSAANFLRYGEAALIDLQHALQEAAAENESRRTVQQDDAESRRDIVFRDRVCAENLRYVYPNQTIAAVEDVSLCIRRGESVGVVGSSGSGKTTLIDLLIGLLQPQRGRVTVDGVPIALGLRSWMDNIAYIPQSVFLIDDSILANVAFGVPPEQVDHQRVAESLSLAQLATMVSALPERENTLVGERGARLSGGQRQRLALARALYKQRDLLVMDEGTAALDTETEREVVEAIRGLHGRVTMIVIAHRLSTLRYCDTIYSVEHGRVVASGTYQELLADEA